MIIINILIFNYLRSKIIMIFNIFTTFALWIYWRILKDYEKNQGILKLK